MIFFIMFRQPERKWNGKTYSVPNIIKKSILGNSYNIERYLDKYYFKKKLLEKLAVLYVQPIYRVISNYLNTYKVFSNRAIYEPFDEIYKQDLAKTKWSC